MAGGREARAERSRSPRGQGELLRRDILEAVSRLLDEWGSAEKLTMRAVAREAGIAAPSIYLHFSDKAELVWAALEDKYEVLAGRMLKAEADAAAAGADARERLKAQAVAYCAFAREFAGHYRLMYETRQPRVEPARLHRHPSRHISHALREGLARCREAGHALALPDEQAAQTLWSGMHGAITLHQALAEGPTHVDLPARLATGLIEAMVPSESTGAAQPPAADTETARQLREILAGFGEPVS
ncbi:TetR/AcrR family transcriptional regulator [Streptomyces sulphureus]|uniref:TetR/AcrR family transcriptional regulator n=1 Tax=Streptomyces sulphureus TaxID=47758 RepID=UPI00035E6245|nr:TetR/AcrR family transcriptional regulator [Streptomyces sulphureus]